MNRAHLAMRTLRARSRHARGASLIEILVVAALFAIGVSGIVALQARAALASTSAQDSTRASLLANELVSVMWTAQTVALPNEKLEEWQRQVNDVRRGGLPEGQGDVAVQGNVATITVEWRPPQADGTTNRYTTRVQLP